jgi:hypothetical protein
MVEENKSILKALLFSMIGRRNIQSHTAAAEE